MLASAVAILIAPAGGERNRLIARVARPLFVAHVIALVWAGFSVESWRSAGPSWSSALKTAYVKNCAEAASDAVVLVRTDRLGTWPIPLTCRDVASAQ
jgi:hypothetical protein